MGGTFTAFNKVRPGAYINFETLPKPLLTVGARGVATMPITANWGKSGELMEVLPTDLINGNFNKWFGDTDTLLFELMLSSCSKALVYRVNTGIKAAADLGDLDVEAKFGGTYGNKIGVGVLTGGKVVTVVDGVTMDEQTVSDFSELKDNDYVVFTGAGSPTETVITMLTGGTNGTASYDNYFTALQTAKWQVLAVTDTTQNSKATSLVKDMRDSQGIKVQAVVSSTESIDYEGVIKIKQSVSLENGVIVTPAELTAYVAGITAGAAISQSNTAKATPFVAIANELTNSEIEADLQRGFLLFSSMADGGVKVEQDINSLTTFTSTKGKMFAKNKVIRVIDEIGNTITGTFEKSYMGKVSNNDMGRTSFKADLVTYFNQLQALQAIKNFDPKDILVAQGANPDEIIVSAGIQPVDAIEKAYITVKLS